MLEFILFYIYYLFISYFTELIIFDFKKHIRKDEFLKDVKFGYFRNNWREQYYKNKYMNSSNISLNHAEGKSNASCVGTNEMSGDRR